MKTEQYASPPTEWTVTKSTAQPVEFAAPCAAQERLIQEKNMVVATYACNVGDLLYVVIISPLAILSAADRDHWAERFSVEQVQNMQKRAAERGIETTVQPGYRVRYSDAQGVHLRMAVGDRKVVMRAVANEHTGVCLQVMSKGPDPDPTAAQFFNSVKLK